MPVTLEDILNDIEKDSSIIGNAFVLKLMREYLANCTTEKEKNRLRLAIQNKDGEKILATLLRKK